MKRLLFQAVFLAMGMIMGVYASGDVGLDLMCGALVAVCCAAVGEYASGSWLAMTLIVMLDCGACLVPAWYLMLPIAAFNAASSSAVEIEIKLDPPLSSMAAASCKRWCRDGCGFFP